MGRLRHCKPAHIKLKPDKKPYDSQYYNLHKAYEDAAMKEIQHMVNIGVFKELPWHNDSPWALPSFGVLKETWVICVMTDYKELAKFVGIDLFLLQRIN